MSAFTRHQENSNLTHCLRSLFVLVLIVFLTLVSSEGISVAQAHPIGPSAAARLRLKADQATVDARNIAESINRGSTPSSYCGEGRKALQALKAFRQSLKAAQINLIGQFVLIALQFGTPENIDLEAPGNEDLLSVVLGEESLTSETNAISKALRELDSVIQLLERKISLFC